MNEKEAQELADLLKALGEFNRLSLVYELCQCKAPQNAMCLCEYCSVDASGVSRHLKVLSQEGIVSSERKGREIQYSLNKTEVLKRLRKLIEFIEAAPSLET
ncbi:MAG: helix-turn-helix transcriptional regulator [Leptolyngbya sp. SIOISBB]|nr:helix-turn-helix transcriptional regulator [Leptolyngbya sp. SIOISBB]